MTLFQSTLLQLLFPALLIFLFAGNLVAILIGAGMILRAESMFRFFGLMNRWVSMRKALRPVEIPRNLEIGSTWGPVLLGITFSFGASISMVALLRTYEVAAVTAMFRGSLPPVLLEMAAQGAKGFLVVGNALFPLRRKADYRVVPWTTFTDPEVARVGLTEPEARARRGDVRAYRYSFGDLDRAIIDGQGKGFVKVVCTPKGHILGAHVIGPHAGEVIQELVLAMKARIKIGALSQTIHTYPTLSEAVRRAADAYYREKLFSGRLPRVLRKVFEFLR